MNEPEPDVNGKCIQCGDCCREVDSNFWYDHNTFTKAELKLIRSKMVDVKVGCKALDGNVCIIHRELGVERTGRYCKTYCCKKEGAITK